MTLPPIHSTIRATALCSVLIATFAFHPAPQAADAPPIVDPRGSNQPPADAIVLFDGTHLNEFRNASGETPAWSVKEGILTSVPGTGNLFTRRAFGDIQLHIEWRVGDEGKTGESNGNSGIKFHEAYEIQILNSYGMSPERSKGQAGAIYNQHPPYVNACRPPGEWQTYEIVFRSPYFSPNGRLIKNGTFTIFHNGVLVQDHENVLGRTNSNVPARPDYKQPFFLQDHGSRVSFRNIWVRELERKSIEGAQRGGPRRRVLAADYTKGKRRLYLVDPDGNVLFKHTIRNLHDAHVLPNGNILFQTDWTEIVETDPLGNVVWSYDAQKGGNEGQKVEVHAIQRLPDGLTLLAESGPARLIEVDREGRIRKEVRLQVDNPNPHRDTRNVRKIASGNYLVAHEGDGVVREYDGDGKVVWQYKVDGPIYSAIRLTSGNTLIGGGGLHQVLEVSPDGQIVWKIDENELDNIRLGWITQVARLKNGNTLFVNCHAGPENPQIVEVDAAKNVVWTFKDLRLFGNNMAAAHVLDTDFEAR